MNELTCPECKYIFFADDYDSGCCPNCGKCYYYWDDGWDYEKEECNNEGFYWDYNEIINLV